MIGEHHGMHIWQEHGITIFRLNECDQHVFEKMDFSLIRTQLHEDLNTRDRKNSTNYRRFKSFWRRRS